MLAHGELNSVTPSYTPNSKLNISTKKNTLTPIQPQKFETHSNNNNAINLTLANSLIDFKSFNTSKVFPIMEAQTNVSDNVNVKIESKSKQLITPLTNVIKPVFFLLKLNFFYIYN